MDKYHIRKILKDWIVDKKTHWIYLADNSKTYYTYEGSLMSPREVKYDDKEGTFTYIH